MKINCNYTPSFGAKLISNKHEIGKLVELSYNQTPISFVKIEPQNAGDIKALEQVAKNWLYGKFATNVYHAACALRDDSKYYKDNEIYALTSQNSDFENLDNKKILGLVHTSKFSEGDIFIEHIESNPEMVYFKNPEYKGIGTAMLDSLKEFSH